MSKTTTRKKHWSKNLEESGVKLRIYERAASGSVWCSLIPKKPMDVRMPLARGKDLKEGDKLRLSLETGDRKRAEDIACAIRRGPPHG